LKPDIKKTKNIKADWMEKLNLSGSGELNKFVVKCTSYEVYV